MKKHLLLLVILPLLLYVKGNAQAPVIAYTTPSVFVYGTTITDLTPDASGGGAVVSYAISPALPAGLSIDVNTGIISGTPTTVSPATDYTITASNGLGDGTFTINITVDKATLTATADDKTKVYGAANPTLTVTLSGFVNGDTPAIINTLPTANTTATNTSSVGSYTITPSGGSDNNYTFNYVNGSLSVTQATLTATADDKTKVYGTANPALTVTLSGFVNGDTPASINTLPTANTTATAASSVGSYTITPSGGSDNNYTFSYVNGSLSVTQATLTATADDKTKVYGAANPTLTISYTGFVNGDTPASINTLPTANTTAAAASSVGSYTITPSGGSDNNYTFNYVNGSLSVTQATLTATADDKTKVYGTANPALTVTLSGFVNGDTPASINTLPTANTTATAASSVGSYTITPSGGSDNNYTFNYVNGSLSVTQATLTATADDKTKVYGAANPTLTISYTGFVNGDTQANINTLPMVNTTATAASSVGSYTITPSSGIDNNYTFNYVNGSLSVTQATLTITANNQGKIYGAVNPTLTAQFTGFVNGDTQASLSVQPTILTTATTTSGVGNYPITVSGAIDNNYTINYVAGTLNITAASLTITANNQNKTYGTTLTGGVGSSAFTITSGSLQNGNTISSVTITYGTGATAGSAVGTYTNSVTPSAAVGANGFIASNYNITYASGNIIVGQANLTITANNQNKTYGTAFSFAGTEFTPTGLKNSDAVTSATITSTGAVATATVAGSTYPIIPSNAVGSGLANYNITYTNGAMTVNKATLTVTASNQTKTYGTTFTFAGTEFTPTGLKNSDAVTSATITSTGAVATATVAGSTYTIIPSNAVGSGLTNYNITYTNGAMTVNKVTLTITATGPTKTYGTALTTGSSTTNFTAVGLATGEIVNSVTLTPNAAGLSTTTAAGNTYTVTPSAAIGSGGFNTTNYNITYVPYSGTVSKAPLTITATGPTKTYGTALTTTTGSTNFSSTGLVNGETINRVTLTPDAAGASATTAAGSAYVVTPSNAFATFGNFNAANYSITYVPYNGTVTQATLTITASNQTKTYGTTFTFAGTEFTTTGLKNSDAVTSATITSTGAVATATVAGNTYPIIPSNAVGSGLTNYNITYTNGAMTVNKATLTVTANNQTKIYGSTNPTLTITYSGFVNGDSQASLTTQPTATTTATTASNVGSYTITPAGGVSANYSFTYVTGSLTVTKATLTVTANNQTKTYGSANPTLSIAYAGFVNGDNQFNLTTQPTASTTAITSSPIGTYPITVTGGVSTNYSFTYVAGTLTVTQAVLTITANNQSRAYGAANPTFTFTYSGFVNGDTQAVVTGTTATTSATTASNVGTYNIVPSGASAPAYYTINYVNGTLTVTTANITITANNVTKTYGTTLTGGTGSTAFTITSGTLQNGNTISSVTITYGTGATAGSPVNIYNNSVTPSAAVGANGFIANNYTINYASGSITVNPNIYTWTGTTSVNWNVSTNWSPNGVPGTNDDVVIPATTTKPTVNVSSTCNNLSFTGNTTITIAKGTNNTNNAIVLTVNTAVSIPSGVTATISMPLGAPTFTAGNAPLTYSEFDIGGTLTNAGTLSVNNGVLQVDAGSTITNSGTFTANGGNMINLSGNGGTAYNAITNSGTFYAGTSNSACTLIVDDGSSITNSGTFYLGSTSVLQYYNTQSHNCNVTNSGTFTLQSDANGSATITAIPQTNGGNSFTGTFRVERYLSAKRAYRLIASPVYAATSSSNKVYSLNYVQSSAYITGTSATGGFDKVTQGPTLYLYREDVPFSNASFISGNFQSINSLTSGNNATPTYTFDATTGNAGKTSGSYSIPNSNGFLFFFRGNRADGNVAQETVTTWPATTATLTASGLINQGSITFRDWYTPSSGNLGFTGTNPATVQGFNLAGNPYASSIDLNTFTPTNNGTGIFYANLSPYIYELNPANGNYSQYAAYTKGPIIQGTTAGAPGASRYIVSGEGFFVLATSSSAQLIFNETAKTNTQNTGASLFMGKPADFLTNNQLLKLQLAKDSVNTDDMVIGFDSNAKTAFDITEDAPYRAGSGKVSLSSLSTDRMPLAINLMPLNKKSQSIALKVGATADGTYTLNLTQLQGIPRLYDVWLMDGYKKDSVNMRDSKTYRFDIIHADTNSFGTHRFALVIRQNPSYAYHLLNFTAQKAPTANREVQVKWLTENEGNFTYFTVERSTDGGKTFNVLGGATASNAGNYSVLDKNPANQNLYRLKQVDINNVISYSNVVPVGYANLSNNLTKANITLYPNPTSDLVNVTIDTPNAESYDILITNSAGIVIQQVTSQQAQWQSNVSNFLPGTYYIQVTNNKDKSLIGQSKFVKL